MKCAYIYMYMYIYTYNLLGEFSAQVNIHKDTHVYMCFTPFVQ